MPSEGRRFAANGGRPVGRAPDRARPFTSLSIIVDHEGGGNKMLSGLSLTLALAGMLASPVIAAGGQARKITAPETITANAQATGSTGAVATRITIQIDRYSPEADRNAVADALKHGGYPGFVAALRKAPVVGTVTVAGQTFDIRWAREQPAGTGRSIVLITDKPVYFVGGGSTTAKPRQGYEVAVLQFRLDDSGLGFDGTMAAAARVKPGGPTGVQIDDYAEKPIELQSVTRAIK